MKNIARLILSLGLMLGTVSMLQAQLPERALEKPRKYVRPLENVQYDQDNDRFNGNIWFVYGDRKNAKTSQTPGGAPGFKSTAFADFYVVVEEKGEHIHIVKDPEVDYRGRLSASAVDYGWIHKGEMLIWEHCMLSLKTGNLFRKAMILNTLESLDNSRKSDFNQLQAGKVNFFLNPQRTIPSGRSSGLFQIYFIFKESNGSYLLGRTNQFARGGQDVIVGWVDKSRIVDWDQRVALEPNWTKPAVDERKAAGQQAKIFLDRESAASYKTSGKAPNRKVAWDDDPFEKRRIGDYRRFPILEGKISDGIAQVGVMGEINTENYKISAEQFANTTRVLTQGKAMARNFDIVFVLDATSSMDPYFPPVQKALKEAVRDIVNNPGENNTYRFGSVVYRDQAEGKYLHEVQPLDSDEKKVLGFLDGVITNYDSRNKNDRDIPEAMYYGLRAGLREVGLNKRHTNIIILVGDVGNHSRDDKSQVRPSELTPLLTDYSCNVIAFQTINKENNAYDEFVTQNKYLIRKVAENNFFKITSDAKVTGIELTYPKWEPDPADPNILRMANGALSGCILSAAKGYKLETERLEGEIQRLIKDLREFNNMVLTEVENVVAEGEDIDVVVSTTPESQSPYVSSFPAAMLLFLKQQGYSQEELKAISAKSYQFFTQGFAVTKADGLENSHFKPVLFLSRKEIASLIIDMEKLNISTNAGDLREQMINAWKELIRAHIGDIPRKQMEEMSIEEISEKVFGIPSETGFTENRLKDLSDESVVDDYKLNEFLSEIKTKIKALDRIFNLNEYDYSFRSNDVTYYWIEQDVIP